VPARPGRPELLAAGPSRGAARAAGPAQAGRLVGVTRRGSSSAQGSDHGAGWGRLDAGPGSVRRGLELPGSVVGGCVVVG